MRVVRDTDLNCLDPGVKRLMNPHIYHVSLSEGLWALKQELIAEARPHVTADLPDSPAPQVRPDSPH